MQRNEMNSIVIGIGEYFVSDEPSDVIKTYALGSCVAVIMFDKIKKIAGLVHIALPDSMISVEKKNNLPGYFADTGIFTLLEEMKKKGANLRDIWIKIIGGANVLHTEYKFDIGIRNVLAIKKILWRVNLGVIAEDIGGKIARTCILNVGTGEITISSNNNKWKI